MLSKIAVWWGFTARMDHRTAGLTLPPPPGPRPWYSELPRFLVRPFSAVAASSSWKPEVGWFTGTHPASSEGGAQRWCPRGEGWLLSSGRQTVPGQRPACAKSPLETRMSPSLGLPIVVQNHCVAASPEPSTSAPWGVGTGNQCNH